MAEGEAPESPRIDQRPTIMQWLILLLLIPMVLVPIVLLYGFAGCGTYIDTSVPPASSFTKPTSLVGESVSSSEVHLSWNITVGEAAVFKVRRIEENDTGVPLEISQGKEPSMGSFVDKGESTPLKPGTTYIYTVIATATAGGTTPDSEVSDQAFVTTFPAPSVVAGTARATGEAVDLSWTKSDKATKYILSSRKAGTGTFSPIYTGPDLSTSHLGLTAGNYDYQVIAVVEHGHQKGQAEQDIPSDPSPLITVGVGYNPVFNGAPNVRQDVTGGFCVVQKIISSSLFGGGAKVRITLQAPPAGASLTLDRIYISWVDPAGDDEFDSLPGASSAGGLTKVWDKDVDGGPKVLSGQDLVLGPVDFALDRTKDLLVIFDTAAGGPNQNALMRDASAAGVASYAAGNNTAEAAKTNRTKALYTAAPNNLYLIKLIEAQ